MNPLRKTEHREGRQMSKAKKADRNVLIYRSVIAVLIVIFIVIFVYGLNKVLAMEGTLPPITNEEGLTSAPVTADDGVNFLKRVYALAQESKPKATREDTFSVDGDSIDTGENERLKKMFAFVSGGFEKKLEDSFEDIETDFGESFPDGITLPDFSQADVIPQTYYLCENCGMTSDEAKDKCDECGIETPYTESSRNIKCRYIYYSCRSCGERSDIQKPECEVCGCVYPYNEKYADEYEVTLKLDSESVPEYFSPVGKERIKEILADEIKDRFEIRDIDITYNDVHVYYKVRRMTDELTYLELFRNMTVTAQLEFAPHYNTGETSVTFNITEKNKQSFTWPGIELSSHEMSVEPKATDNLLATLTCTDPTEPVVTWTSSDESVLTVDEEGYIKAGKEAGFATVTASFEFNGKEYSDSCKVNVRYSVESMKLNKRKANLSPGDTLTLKAMPQPSKASVKTVKWYSEDPEIARVDENGTVTAVSKGKTSVYALSDDGYYKSSCEVNVK